MRACQNDIRWISGLKRTLSNLGGWSVEDDYAVNERKQLYVVIDDGNERSLPHSFAIGIAIGNLQAKVCVVCNNDAVQMRRARFPASVEDRIERMSKKAFLNKLIEN